MKNRIITTTLIICCLLLIFTSCSRFGGGGDDSEELAENDSGAYLAYYMIFEDLYAKDPELNENGRNIAVDLTNVRLSDKSLLIDMLQEFCDSNGYTLMLDDLVGLSQAGHIRDLLFVSGFLIIFEDVSLTPEKLVTSALKWRSALGAVGADYTVELKNDEWVITIENEWVS